MGVVVHPRLTEIPVARTVAIVATTLETGQQRDASNGSAPLQWIAVDGLISYGQNRRPTIAYRWVVNVSRVCRQTGKLVVEIR
jgi:alpha,alpha-trehalase